MSKRNKHEVGGEGQDDGAAEAFSKKERKRQRKEEKKARKRAKFEDAPSTDVPNLEESTKTTEDRNDDIIDTVMVELSGEKEKKSAKKEKKKKKDSKKKKKKITKDPVDGSDSHDDIPSSKPTISKDEKKKALDAQHVAESKALTGANDGRIVSSSAIEFYDEAVKQQRKPDQTITLLLFYTYVEPVWDEGTYDFMLKTLQELGDRLNLTGRMRVAKEGLNCTLTGSHDAIVEYCTTLRKLRPKEFDKTEFKLTDDLPMDQRFPNLKVFKVIELVHYGLEGSKAPPIAKYHGTHLEPKDYHKKLAEKDTVVIDVRNHYEAAIGRFAAPNSKWLDPKMRKSTEFPVWLDKPETKEMMRGKQVMMYCTGGIRCERGTWQCCNYVSMHCDESCLRKLMNGKLKFM